MASTFTIYQSSKIGIIDNEITLTDTDYLPFNGFILEATAAIPVTSDIIITGIFYATGNTLPPSYVQNFELTINKTNYSGTTDRFLTGEDAKCTYITDTYLRPDSDSTYNYILNVVIS